MLLLLRWVLIISISYLLLFSGAHENTSPEVALFVALYLASNVILSQILGAVPYQPALEWSVVVVDTLAVTLAISLVNGGSNELFVLYFVVLFLSALSEHVGLVAVAALVISIAHLSTASRFMSVGDLIAQGYILRVPFLFAVGLFFGNLVQNARAQQRDAKEEKARALRREFLSTVSHDLRNPLGVIESLACLLLEGDAGKLSDEQAKLVRRMHSSIRQVLNLAGNLIDAERIDAGHFVLRPAATDLANLVSDAVVLARGAGELKDISIEAAIAADLPPIDIDVVQIERVLANLLGNAIKFTPRRGRIHVAVGRSKENLQVSVRDSGIGIAAEDIARLGTKHFSDPLAQRTDGTGLGLFIVGTVVEAHGGRMEIHSRPHCGTTVTISLPLRHPLVLDAEREDARRQGGLDLPTVAKSA